MKMKNNVNLIWIAVLFLAIGLVAGFLITSGASKTGDAVRGVFKSYEVEKDNLINPEIPVYGQGNEGNSPDPDNIIYCANGQGIIIPEINSNLCWQRVVSQEERNWSDSMTYCQNLNLNELDWDAPTKSEWIKMRNYLCEKYSSDYQLNCPFCNPDTSQQCNSTNCANLYNLLNNNEGFSDFTKSQYWTKTNYHNPNNAWALDLTNARDFYPLKIYLIRTVCVNRS
jgi:hypothetical protein